MFKTLLLKVSVTPFWSFGFEKFDNCFETGNPPEGWDSEGETGNPPEGWESEGQFRYSKLGTHPKGGTPKEKPGTRLKGGSPKDNFGFTCGARRFTSLDFFACWFFLSAIFFLLVACSSTPPATKKSNSYSVGGKRYYPLSSSTGFAQRGLASWYGGKFHGRLTSNGERYNMYGRTAAHKTLPFNTYVRVTNLRNGRKTVVRINDRGPFVRGRIIDLTYTAAHELAMVEHGVVPVKIEALGYARKKRKAGKWVQVYEKPASYMQGDFTIQVGAFAERENALRLHGSLSRKYQNSTVMIFDQGPQRFYRVRVGRYSRLDQAEIAAKRLQEQGFPNAFAVARDK